MSTRICNWPRPHLVCVHSEAERFRGSTIAVVRLRPPRPSGERASAAHLFEIGCASPFLERLQRPPLSLEAREYLEGGHLHECTSLCQLFGMLVWCFGAERSVEEGHARVYHRSSQARNRTGAYDSLSLLIKGIEGAIGARPQLTSELFDVRWLPGCTS